jgi:hypothetical protein
MTFAILGQRIQLFLALRDMLIPYFGGFVLTDRQSNYAKEVGDELFWLCARIGPR